MFKCTFFRSAALSAVFLTAAAFISTAENNSPQSPSPDPLAQKELVVINSVFDYNLDPHTSNYSSEAQILTGLYEGLFIYDPQNLDPVPAVAESYKISRNKLKWTFTLRSDAFFSNGEKITASVMRDSWLNLLKPETNAPFASLLDCISGAAEYRQGTGTRDDVKITAVSETVLSVILTVPTEHFSKILCHHAFSAVLEDRSAYSGPFTLSSHTPQEIVLVRNEKYHSAKSVYLPSIRILLSDDQDENAFLLNTGKAHWAADAVNVKKILDKNTLQFSTQFGTEYLFFKAQNEPWNNEHARNALLYATPWDVLRSQSLIAAETLIVPLRGYPEIGGLNEYDIDIAKEFLDKAGLTGKKLTITMAVTENKYLQNMSEILAKEWAKIGVELIVQKTPSNRYLQSISGWNADLFTYTWIGDFADPLAFLELFRNGSSLRETKWINPSFDKLLEEASQQTDPQQRYNKLAQAEQLLLDSGIILPISHPVSFNVVDKQTLSGWFENPLDIHPFRFMYFTAEKLPYTLVRNTVSSSVL